MLLRVVDATFRTRTLHTRIPFKFGVQILREVPLAELKITAELPSGERAFGRASDLLVPKWFQKNPHSTPEEDSAALLDSARSAADLAIRLGKSAGAHPVFDTWRVLHQELLGTDHTAPDVLVRGFGVSMVERALIDAACTAANCSFDTALRRGILEFKSGQVIRETEGWTPRSLPPPSSSMAIRHTIGMLDPLSSEEVTKKERVEDGLPQTLQEDIETYGVHWFKVKVCGDPTIDVPRLRDISRVVMPLVGDSARFTLDGNEQCHDIEGFAGMLEDLRTDDTAGKLIERLVLIEQPLPRRQTFDPSANHALPRLSAIAPIIIDEADTDADAFRRAIDLGYSGVSIKACKGVFRAIANRALLDVRNDSRLLQSGEDLTNLASIPLQQDLALQATLGIEHVERNGHHYFRGLDHLPTQESAQLASRLPGLYQDNGNGLLSLAIRDGRVELSGLLGEHGFGGQLLSMEDPTSANSE